MTAPSHLLPRESPNYYPPSPSTAILCFVTSFALCIVYCKIKPLPVPKSLPGPTSYPLIGILKYMIDHWEDWPEECVRLSKKYGRTWGGGVPNVRGLNGMFLFVVDEKCVKHILYDNFDNYHKGPSFRSLFRDLLGNGIFVSDGAIWQEHRKITSNMFSRNLLRSTAEVTLSKLHQITALFHENNNTTIDLQDIFFRMTFDTTSYVAFGCEMNSLQALDKGQHHFAQAFDEMQMLITERIVDPLFEIKRFFQIGSRERRIAQLKHILYHESSAIINARRRSVQDGDCLGPDLLSRFLDHSKMVGQPLHDNELHSVVMNILLAGRDTTACALSWAFFEIIKRPDVIQNIVQEATQICGGTNGYTHDTVNQLQYTHAVVMEVLRLHPSVPNDYKFAIHDDVLPDGTFVPAGAGVIWLPRYMGRSEEIWGPDALEFKPERFLNQKEPSMFRYTVFNAGYRLCLGKPLALMTIKMTLAYLLPKFQFVDHLGHSGEYFWTIVSSMKGGLPVKVSKLSDEL